MSPEDPRHGSNAGYIAHIFAKVSPCGPCRAAGAAYQRERDKRLYFSPTGTLRIPAVGYHRRVQALVAIGHPLSSLDHELGNQPGTLSRWLVCRAPWTHEAMARRIMDLYERLSMVVPPEGTARTRALALAERQGWLPPLAWEGIDIDNPNTVGTRGELGPRPNRGRPVAEVLEDAEWMADSDASLTEVIERLGMSQATFRETCGRAGRSDLYFRFARREPDGDMRWEVSQANRRKKAS